MQDWDPNQIKQFRQYHFQHQQLIRNYTFAQPSSNKQFTIATIYVYKKQYHILQRLSNEQLYNYNQTLQQPQQLYLLREISNQGTCNQKQLQHLSDNSSHKQTDSTYVDSAKKILTFKTVQSLEQFNVKIFKSCNCKKSMCLKNYCQCFKDNRICSEECVCIGCQNKFIQINQIRSKKKIVKGIGCNCKKSQCLKKYCECHNMNQKCSAECKCIDCKNNDKIDLEIEVYENLLCKKKIKLQ